MEESRSAGSIKLVALYALLFLGTFGGFFILKALTGTEYPIMVVVSESMEPTLGVGDYIFVRGVRDVNSVNVGDIIVFLKPGSLYNEYVVHRAIGIVQRGGALYYRTKGDNNPVLDWWEVPESNIIGRVYGRIPLIGYFSLFERTSGGIITLIALICLVFLVDYIIPPREIETSTVFSDEENQRRRLSYLTLGLLLLSALPYPLLFFLKDQLVPLEVFALLCWYACDLLLPLTIRDEDNSLMLWIYHFVLLVLPVGSDLIYRLTEITPSKWWHKTRGTVPITWFLSGETHLYYTYLSTLVLMLLPGCIIFFISWGKKRRGQPLLKGLWKNVNLRGTS